MNPLLLALIPAVLFIWVQPIKFSPFIFELSAVRDGLEWFADLENDGKKEKFILSEELVSASLMYYSDDGNLENQQNYKHPLPKKQRAAKIPYSVDCDNDGTKEMVILTQHHDSVFLNVFCYAQDKNIRENRFITKIGGYNDKLDYNLNWIGDFDANGDSQPEIYFSISGGFSLYPRRVFRYDFANDSLIASINTGAGSLPGTLFFKGDSLVLVFGSVAHGNTRKWFPYPYHDTISWLMVFNQDLQLKAPPKAYGHFPGAIGRVFQQGEYAYCLFRGHNIENEKNKVLKLNWDGEVVDSLELEMSGISEFQTIKIKGKKHHYLFLDKTNDFLQLDCKNFKTRKFKKLKLAANNLLLQQADMNRNGKMEYVFHQRLKKQLLVFTGHLRDPIVVPEEEFITIATSNYYENLGYGELLVNSNKQSKTYRYTENPARYWKYPLWFAIYFVSVLFVSIIQYFQNKRIRKQQIMEQQLADLQLQNLQKQLDPHFTFNVLNSVGNAIYKEDKAAAYDLFQRFSRLIRASLLSSDKVFRPLKEELQFTLDYLEFQKIRFPDRFSYAIKADKNVVNRTMAFPKMLVQGFAENAVKHAFYERKGKGQITIEIFRENQKVKVIIEDNGIGIKRSKQSKATAGTGRGEKLLEKQVEQINKLYNKNYSVSIEDKSDRNLEDHGTRITISFGYEFKL